VRKRGRRNGRGGVGVCVCVCVIRGEIVRGKENGERARRERRRE
jgi:hypothetical protein